MKFAPRSQEELAATAAARELFPKGIYPFVVLTAEDKISKSGNEMIALKLDVFHGERSRWVNDYLLPSLEFKLAHFAETAGLKDKYESGELTAEDCVGRSGHVRIDIEPATAEFKAKNVVKDYIVPAEEEAQQPIRSGVKAPAPRPAAPQGDEQQEEDDIPF